jgi:hypothetical protein
MAVPGGWRSLTLMAPQDRSQLAHHPERPHATLDAASVEAVARRVVELIRGEGASHVARCLVDAATLAAELGVERSWVYAHRDELGAIQLGAGSKPRLRFDAEAAREAVAGDARKRAQGSDARAGAESAVAGGRRRCDPPSGLPRPGSVLAVRPQGRT